MVQPIGDRSSGLRDFTLADPDGFRPPIRKPPFELIAATTTSGTGAAADLAGSRPQRPAQLSALSRRGAVKELANLALAFADDVKETLGEVDGLNL